MIKDPKSLLTTVPDPSARRLSTHQIGRLGELLVQYELLRYGIDSAPMTTDSGIDRVAYAGTRGQPITIQVKTNLEPKRGGGKGSLAIDWWVSDNCPAQFYAFVDLSTRRIWLLTRPELESAAQQRSGGRFHLYMYTDRASGRLAHFRHGDDLFDRFLFEKRVPALLL
jgi:hypothetical protein